MRLSAAHVDCVAYRRESFTLLRGKKPLAERRPLPAGARLSELPSLIASLPRLPAAEAGDSADDVATGRVELGEVHDAWQSRSTPAS